MWQNTIITVLPDDLSFRSNNWSFFRLYKILQYLHSADMQLLYQLLCLFLIFTLTIVAYITPYWALDQDTKGPLSVCGSPAHPRNAFHIQVC